jgi:hypothetical protein
MNNIEPDKTIDYDEVGISDCLLFTRRNGQDERSGVVISKTPKVVELHVNGGGPNARLRQQDWEAHNVRLNRDPDEAQRLFQELVWARGEMDKVEQEMRAASSRANEARTSWALAELLASHGVDFTSLTGASSGKALLFTQDAERVMRMLVAGDEAAWPLGEVVDYLAELDIEAKPWPHEKDAEGVAIPIGQIHRLLSEIEYKSKEST